jgi:hypothetical protein
MINSDSRGDPAMNHRTLLPLLLALALLPACQSNSSSGGGDDAGTDTGTADTDTDTDSDTDTDTDGDCVEVDGGSCLDGGVATGLSWTWSIVDTELNELTCEEASAETSRLTITDCTLADHELYWLCSDNPGEATMLNIAPGSSEITADLLTWASTVLSTTSFCFDLAPGSDDNSIGEVVFIVDL